MRIVITRQAETDLDGHFEYLLERNPEAAARVYEAIINQILRLKDFPYMSPAGRVAGTRELVITTYPYIVVYEVDKDDVVILHVNHARQRWPK